MAIGHIQINPNLPHAARLIGALRAIKQGLDDANDAHKTLEQMRDSGPGNPFTQYAVDKYGFADTDGAMAAFNEVSALLAKLNTNASVTDVNGAILQAVRKLG